MPTTEESTMQAAYDAAARAALLADRPHSPPWSDSELAEAVATRSADPVLRAVVDATRRQFLVEIFGEPDPSRTGPDDDPAALRERAVAAARKVAGVELIAEGRQVAADAIRAQADDVPFIYLRNGTRLKAGSAVAWAACVAEGTVDHG